MFEDLEEEEYLVENFKVKRTTSKAILIEFEDGREEWFPKSQISRFTKENFIIPYWLAEEKGLT